MRTAPLLLAAQYNQPDKFIANLAGPDTGHFLKLTAGPDGSFAILNPQTGDTQTYPAAK